MRIRSEHAVGYLKGRFQSLRGLRQQINSERDYILALAWVRTCLIIHSFAGRIEDDEYESDFWEWVEEGRNGEDEREDEEPVEGFMWDGAGPSWPGESEPQRKRRHVQEALFDALY